MKRYLGLFIVLLVLCTSCENINDLLGINDDTEKVETTTDDTTKPPALPPTALGTTFNLNNLTLKSPSGDKNLSGFDGTVYLDSNCTISAGNISDGIISLALPALSSDQLWSTQNTTEGLVFTPNTGKYYNPWIYVKQTGSDILYGLDGITDADSMVKFIYSDTDTILSGSFIGGDNRTYTYNCDLRVGWNWCDWTWPTDRTRKCTTKKHDSYTWHLFTRNIPDIPGCGLDILNTFTLTQWNGVPSDPSTFNGKIYVDEECSLEAGTIVNGTIDFNLPALSTSQLSRALFARDGLVFEPNTGGYFISWIYVKETGDDTTVYRLNGNSGNDSWAKFIYSDTDTLYSGSFSDSKYTYIYNCDLEVGWNWCDWSWPGDQRICEKKNYDYDAYIWYIKVDN